MRPSFRDRFFTPKVARAIMSPLGIVLSGAGAAVGDRRRPADRRRGRHRRGGVGRARARRGRDRSRRPSTPASQRRRAERAVAGLRRRRPRRPRNASTGGRHASRPDRCGSGSPGLSGGSTTASTSRGGSPGGATRSSAPSAGSTPSRPSASWPSCGHSVGDRAPTPAEQRHGQGARGPARLGPPAQRPRHPQSRPAAPARRPLRRARRPDRRGERRRRRHRGPRRRRRRAGRPSWRRCASRWRRRAGPPTRAGLPATERRPPADAVVSDLLRSNLVVATGTALSRITGLVRVVVFGAVIGQTALADAYTIGNETPNIVYELLLGGVLSATLVPLFTSFVEQRRRGVDQRRDHGDAGRALAALTVVAVVAAPLIFAAVHAVARRRRRRRRSSARVGTMLTRIFLIQIFFYGAHGAGQRLPATPAAASSPRRGARSCPT